MLPLALTTPAAPFREQSARQDPAPLGRREEHVLDFLFGEGQYGLRFLFAFIVVLGLIGLTAWLVRRFGATHLGATAARGRQPRQSGSAQFRQSCRCECANRLPCGRPRSRSVRYG